MIHVEKLTKEYSDLRRGKLVALAGIGFEALAGRDLRPAGSQRRRQDHGAADHRARCCADVGGTVTVNGFDVVTQPSEVRHQIGFVSANTGMYDRMTAWEMVEYFGRLYGIADEPLRERMEQLFDRLKMNEIRDVLGAKMSTGMKQKVSIARAIVHDPPVLIFDEATNGLDVLVARALLDTVCELREQGKCILFSTHIMREAEKLCDRIAIVHRGHILTDRDARSARRSARRARSRGVVLSPDLAA